MGDITSRSTSCKSNNECPSPRVITRELVGYRWIQIVLGLLLTAAVFPAVAADDATQFEKFRSIWNSQRSEIVTAQIKYRIFRRGDLRPLKPDEVEDIINSVDLVGRPDDLRKVVKQLALKIPTADPPWSADQLHIAGAKSRVSGSWGDIVNDGEQQIVTDPSNQQTDLYRPGMSGRGHTVLRDFRYVPSPRAVEKFISPSQSNGRLTFQGEAWELVVDDATGFVYRFSHRSASGAERLIIQQGATVFPGDILFPTVSVHADFNGSEGLSHITIRIIEAARFNEDLPPNAFKVGVSANTQVIDYRENRHQPRSANVTKTVSDIVAHIDSGEVGHEPQPSESSSLFWPVFAVVNAVILGAIGIWLLKRRR